MATHAGGMISLLTVSGPGYIIGTAAPRMVGVAMPLFDLFMPLTVISSLRVPRVVGGLDTTGAPLPGTGTPAAPTAALSADDDSITLGQSVTLAWISSGAVACQAVGDWSGSKIATGTQVVTPTEEGTANYALVFSNAGGATIETVSIDVAPAAPPPNVSKVRGSVVKNSAPVQRRVVVLDATSGEPLGSAVSGSSDGAFEIDLPVTSDVVAVCLPATTGEKPFTYRATPEPL